MSNLVEKGSRTFRGVRKGSPGTSPCSPDYFFTKDGKRWEQSFFCLQCGETKLYPIKVEEPYLIQKLLCPECLKFWVDKLFNVLAAGKIVGVADYQAGLTELKKLYPHIRERVYHNEHR